MNKLVTLIVALALMYVGVTYSGIVALGVALIFAATLLIKRLDIFGFKPSAIVSIIGIIVMAVFGGMIPTGMTQEYTGYAPTLTVPSAQVPTATGLSYTGQIDLKPTQSNGETYAATGKIAFVDDIGSNRYAMMKLITNNGESAVKFQGVPAKFMTVSSGSFQDTQLSARVGDRMGVFGYLDATPAATENKSFYDVIELTGFNPQSGSVGGIWSWKYSSTGTNKLQWYNYPTVDWYDSTETVRDGYYDDQDSAVSGQSITVYVHATANGQQWIDPALYIDVPATDAGKITKVTVTSPGGIKQEFTTLTNTADLSTGSPEYIAAPATNTTGITSGIIYYVGKIPVDSPAGLARTGSSVAQLSRAQIDVQYDHPGTGRLIFELNGVENGGALTSTGGHFDWNDDFQVNASTDLTTQWG